MRGWGAGCDPEDYVLSMVWYGIYVPVLTERGTDVSIDLSDDPPGLDGASLISGSGFLEARMGGLVDAMMVMMMITIGTMYLITSSAARTMQATSQTAPHHRITAYIHPPPV